MSSLLTQFSRRMRKRPTPAEKRFKKILAVCCSGLGIQFEDQKVFWNQGDQYGIIADFYIARCRVIFEIDGGYHNKPEQQEKDSKKDNWFQTQSIKVIRISNELTEDSEYCKRLILNSLAYSQKYKRQVKKITNDKNERKKLIAKCPQRIEDGNIVIECPPAGITWGKPSKKQGKIGKRRNCKLETPGTFKGSILWKT